MSSIVFHCIQLPCTSSWPQLCFMQFGGCLWLLGLFQRQWLCQLNLHNSIYLSLWRQDLARSTDSDIRVWGPWVALITSRMVVLVCITHHMGTLLKTLFPKTYFPEIQIQWVLGQTQVTCKFHRLIILSLLHTPSFRFWCKWVLVPHPEECPCIFLFCHVPLLWRWVSQK